MTYSTIAVIYNPNSTGSSGAMAKNFVKKLRTRMPKQKIELIGTEHAGHAEELAYSIASTSKKSLIISSSGDGGYNEVVNGAMKAQKEGAIVTTGLLPGGNANDHHRNLHEKDIIEAIVDNETRDIDLLKIRGRTSGKRVTRYAHSYIGFGLTPNVSVELNKTKLNIFNEIWLVARVLFIVRSVKLRIGFKVGHYDSIVISNVDSMAKYVKISQTSSVTDGKFEVTIFKRRNKLQLISVLLKASLAGVKEDMRVSKFSLRTVEKTAVQTDGELMMLDAKSRVVITAEKQILNCIV